MTHFLIIFGAGWVGLGQNVHGFGSGRARYFGPDLSSNRERKRERKRENYIKEREMQKKASDKK